MPVELDYIAIFIAGLAYFVLGAIWYSPKVFGKAWMADQNLPADHKPVNPGLLFGGSFLVSVLVAFGIHYVMALGNISGLRGGLLTGLGIGIFIYAFLALPHYAFPARPQRLFLIDTGYSVAGCALMGAIIGLMA